jgi:cold shock CspA family protein
MQGTVESLRTERGFGFVRDVQGGEVIFRHTALLSPDYFATLPIGTVVAFEVEPSLKGPRTTRVARRPKHC